MREMCTTAMKTYAVKKCLNVNDVICTYTTYEEYAENKFCIRQEKRVVRFGTIQSNT